MTVNTLASRTGVSIRTLNRLLDGGEVGEENGARILVVGHGDVQGYPEFRGIITAPRVLRGAWRPDCHGIQRYREADR
jgi:hypothetical protein